jgi:hypothetical protein
MMSSKTKRIRVSVMGDFESTATSWSATVPPQREAAAVNDRAFFFLQTTLRIHRELFNWTC